MPSGPGNFSYLNQETGNKKTGSFSLNESGQSRYALLELWNNVSNTTAGFTPGQLDFFSFGVPFVDPGPGGGIGWAVSLGFGAFSLPASPLDLTTNLVENLYRQVVDTARAQFGAIFDASLGAVLSPFITGIQLAKDVGNATAAAVLSPFITGIQLAKDVGNAAAGLVAVQLAVGTQVVGRGLAMGAATLDTLVAGAYVVGNFTVGFLHGFGEVMLFMNPPTPENRAQEIGRIFGQYAAIGVSIWEMATGAPLAFGGSAVLVTTAGTTTPVAGAVSIVGVGMIVHGGIAFARGIYVVSMGAPGNKGGSSTGPTKPAKPGPAKINPNAPKLPSDAQKALTEIEQGVARPNVRNPRPFVNDGRGGTPRLPSQDAAGKPITYTEHTVNPRPPGGTLDGKRIVLGSDGSVWYTDNHFTTWTRVK